jgi:hypothetical protein
MRPRQIVQFLFMLSRQLHPVRPCEPARYPLQVDWMLHMAVGFTPIAYSPPKRPDATQIGGARQMHFSSHTYNKEREPDEGLALIWFSTFSAIWSV